MKQISTTLPDLCTHNCFRLFIGTLKKVKKKKIYLHKVAIGKVHLKQITFNCIQFYASTTTRQITETVANFSLFSLFNKSYPCNKNLFVFRSVNVSLEVFT